MNLRHAKRQNEGTYQSEACIMSIAFPHNTFAFALFQQVLKTVERLTPHKASQLNRKSWSQPFTLSGDLQHPSRSKQDTTQGTRRLASVRAKRDRTGACLPAGDAEALYPLVLLGQVLLHLLPHVEDGAVTAGGTKDELQR